ncbi:MAG: selenocysteine-specific translation elongation factor [Bythopirellula sp.]
MQRNLLLGTAGHIDHGKTSLIKALTGVDTDRLPEEKQRGITVDLGFAALELENLLLGVVDVPGHERFIKNMLAGATGIDLALLVVAADEGVMPQTREHFEALRYLQIATGVVAITKCDLVDEEMLELVEEDVNQLIAGSTLQDAAIVPVSAKTGEGLDRLRTELAQAAGRVALEDSGGPFRLSIDRCFSATGQGTVVTGSVVRGQAACGDRLELLPGGTAVTVRKIESHGQDLQSIHRGQRAALNLAGVHFKDIARGDILATPASLVPSKMLSVNIEASRYRDRPIDARSAIRCYCGTAEIAGRLRLLETKELAPGDSQIAQIELQQPVCCWWGESFVLRGLAANEVIGGGQIADPRAYRVAWQDQGRISTIRELLSGEPAARVAAVAALAGARSWSLVDLSQRAGVVDADAIVERLVADGVLCRIELKGGSRFLHADVLQQLAARLQESLAHEHQQDCLRGTIPLGRLQKHFDTLEPRELLIPLARTLAEAGQLRIDGESAALPDWQPQLSAKQADAIVHILATYEQAALTPPTVAQCAAELDRPIDEVEELLEIAVSRKELIRLPDKDTRDAKAAQRARLYLHCRAEQHLQDRLAALAADTPEWTISQFGEELGLSRKYAIPLCNYLDQNGITVRQGDLRKLAPETSRST